MATSTLSRPARTTRVPGAFAGVGAVRQSGGSLPIYRCNTCGDEVVWCTSTRTGGKYLANVSHGHLDQRYYIAAAVHECRPQAPAADDKTARYAALTEQMLDLARRVAGANGRGDTERVEELLAEMAEIEAAQNALLGR